MKKITVLIIHGGMTFKSQRDYLHYLKSKRVSLEPRVSWAGNYLEKNLGKRFHIVRPRMPLQDNAKYKDWKIMFERYLPLIKGRYILIGSSLGGVFLAKYLSENKLERKALSAYLVCPPFDNSLSGEDLVGGFTLTADLSEIEKNCKNLYLLFSHDDDVVPPSHAKKYAAKLKRAHILVLKGKNGHFNIPAFPEIATFIKTDAKKN